eukprot:GSChrysophyteH1.ASY1.ANO1.177.1 assembled CDS
MGISHFCLLCVWLFGSVAADNSGIADLTFINIAGASISGVNGAYICSKPGVCTEAGSDDMRYSLSAVNKMTSSGIQKRWYVLDNTLPKGKQHVYGAVEKSKEPWELHVWKLLQGGGAVVEERLMKVELLSFRCDQQRAEVESTGKMLVRLQAGTQALTNPPQLDSLSFRATKAASATCVRTLLRMPTLPTAGDGSTSCCTAELQEIQSVSSAREMGLVLPVAVMLPVCEWALAVGSWDVARRCYAYHITSAQKQNKEFFGDKEVYCIRRYALLLLVLETDTTEVMQMHPQWFQSLPHSEAHNDRSDEILWWKSMYRVAYFISHGVTIHTNDNTTAATGALQKVCGALQATANSLFTQASKELFVQVCHYLRVEDREEITAVPVPAHLPAEYMALHTDITVYAVSLDTISSLVVTLLGIGSLTEVGHLVCSATAHSLIMTSFSRGEISEDLTADYLQLLEYCQQQQFPQEVMWTHFGEKARYAIQSIWGSSLTLSEDVIKAVTEATRLHGLVQLLAAGPGAPLPWQYLPSLLRRDRLLQVTQSENLSFIPLLLSTMLQLSAPVVLTSAVSNSDLMSLTSSNASLATAEAVLLRVLAVDVLTTLNDRICVLREHDAPHEYESLPACAVRDPVSAIGVRGLFLLAYQGITPVHSSSVYHDRERSNNAISALNMLHDSAIPLGYRKFMQLTQLNWPWWYAPLAPLVDGQSVSSDAIDPGVKKAGRRENVKVAFISSFFFKHSVGRLLGSVIEGLSSIDFSSDATGLDIHIVDMRFNTQNIDLGDSITESLRKSGRRARLTSSPADCVQYLREQHFDVVIYGDNFMDSVLGHVIMMRVAPVIVVFWGHPFTTGFHEAVDYFVTKQLIRFESLSFLMYPPDQMTQNDGGGGESRGAVGETSPSLMDFWGQRVTTAVLSDEKLHYYSCLQSLMKMHPLFDVALVGILSRDKNAILLLLENKRQPVWQQRWKQRILKLIHQNAESHEDAFAMQKRLYFAPQSSHKNYKAMLCSPRGPHVVLDPFPFGGGVTLVDSLSCDVHSSSENNVQSHSFPMVLTSGNLQSVHRLGNGILKELGTDEQISKNFECCRPLIKSPMKTQKEKEIMVTKRSCIFEKDKTSQAQAARLKGLALEMPNGITTNLTTHSRVHAYIETAICMTRTRNSKSSSMYTQAFFADKVPQLFGSTAARTNAEHNVVLEWKELLLRIT